MNKLRIGLTLFVLLLAHVGIAQQDSLYTDTVIVVKDPIIVKKQVIAPDIKVSPAPTKNPWGLEAFFTYGKPIHISSSDSVKLSPVSSLNVGILLTRKLGNWELGTGILLSSNSFNYQKSKTESYSYAKDSTYNKVLTQYTQLYHGVDSTTYIFQKRDTVLTKHQSKTTTSTGNNSYSYLQIPISIGYRLNLWQHKLFLIPRVQFITGIRVKYDDGSFETPQPIVLSYAAQLNIMYAITARINVLLKANWQSNITKVYSYEPQSQNWENIGLGIGFGINF
jgi:hypothetical protein